MTSSGAPRVSVVVPFRDRRALLRACLDALAAQTLREHEVIAVDDGSSDGAGDEALAEAANGRAVQLLVNPGRGAVAARRAGVAASTAPYLAFTDSDCRPQPGWLAAGVAALDEGADVVAGTTRPARTPRPLERTVAVAHDDGLYPTCNVFYRRSAYDAAGGFDEQLGARLGFRPGAGLADLGLGEDTVLGWRVRRAGRAAFADGAVVEHEVFPPDVAESLRRAWTAGAFPALVREVPELRTTLLSGRVLLGRAGRAAMYATAAAWLTRRRAAALVAASMWAGSRLAASAPDASWRQRARLLPVLPAELAVEAVGGVALVAGSARARTLVL